MRKLRVGARFFFFFFFRRIRQERGEEIYTNVYYIRSKEFGTTYACERRTITDRIATSYSRVTVPLPSLTLGLLSSRTRTRTRIRITSRSTENLSSLLPDRSYTSPNRVYLKCNRYEFLNTQTLFRYGYKYIKALGITRTTRARFLNESRGKERDKRYISISTVEFELARIRELTSLRKEKEIILNPR